MLTSSTGRRARMACTTRPSMPSYRPQANTSHGSAAYRAARSWVNGTPLGVGTTSRAPGEPARIASSASPQTSGFMTMPGPPPNGTSSTVWCTSVAQDRRSCTPNSMSPRAAAFPISETRSGLSKYSGKIVTMSIRSGGVRPTSSPFLFSERAVVLVVRPRLRLRGVKEASRRVDDEHAGGHVHLRHDRLHERHQVLLARGTPDHEQVLAVVQHVGDHADRLAGRRPHRQPDQLVIAELVRVGGRWQLAGIHAQPAAGQLPGCRPVADPGERDQELPGVPVLADDPEDLVRRGIAVGGRPGVQAGAHGEAEVRLVGPDPDHDLAADPVRAADAADDDPHRVSGPRSRPAGRCARSGPTPGRRSRCAGPGRYARPGR